MRYLLDTNVFIHAMRKPFGKLAAKIKQIPHAEIGISIVTAAELLAGANRRKATSAQRDATNEFVGLFSWISFEPADAVAYGRIGGALMDAGTKIGAMDLQIAVSALNRGLTVVTHNVDEFSRVPGLLLEDWQAEAGEIP